MAQGFVTIPTVSTMHLANARLPGAALASSEGLGAQDRDGFVRADIHVANGRIAAVAAPGMAWPGPVVNLDGGQIWPAFVDLHTHLDKGHIWPRADNAAGTLDGARASTMADRAAHWRHDDVERRFEFGLRSAYAHGTRAIRTHLDCMDLAQSQTSWAVFRELRERWAPRMAVQACSLTLLDWYATPDGEALARLVARSDGVLGGITRLAKPDATPADMDAALDHLFTIAKHFGLDIDLHVDETGDPAANALAQVAAASLRHGFSGKVTCGHCCSLSVQSDAVARRTIALCREAGLTVVSLPMVNQFLQGRIDGGTPRWRGVTLLRELAAAGVPTAVASDNCRDPFFAFGDHDILEVLEQAVRIGHLNSEFAAWPPAVGWIPAAAMRLAGAGRIAAGASADLVLFRARGVSELLSRPQADRVVLHAGRAIDTTPPDYRELDDLLA
ncbi:MAG: cytosine deaminase [Alphaproteobacteria bacterium]|nr:cytosine deaminase [Alphaproteobacteria bacterium]